MSIQRLTLTLAAFLMASSAATSVAAQDKTAATLSTDTVETQAYRAPWVKRQVQAVEYWVDAETLRVRDNPVAGNVVRTLNHTNKIAAYGQYENWVRISKPDAKDQWVNSDFLSNSPISWASFDRSLPKRSSDVTVTRIKNPDDRKSRVFAVRLKTADTGNAIITTRETTTEGVLYQNRFVSCDKKRPVGARLIGEGSNFLAAQDDPRNYAVDIYRSEQIESKIERGIESAISGFACKSDEF